MPKVAAIAAGDRQRLPEAPAELGRQQRVGIGADRVEGDVAEVEQAGEADHHVQAPAEHHVDQHRRGGVDDVAVVGEHDRQRERDPPSATQPSTFTTRCAPGAAPAAAVLARSRELAACAPGRRPAQQQAAGEHRGEE
jgi:hypothetical protein